MDQPTTVGTLLSEHPTNIVNSALNSTGTNKAWATNNYPVITRIIFHDDYDTLAELFDGPFLPEFDDDASRQEAPAFRTNNRFWSLETEEDCIQWFHSEVSNIVLPAFSQYPAVLQQCQPKPFGVENMPEMVDLTFTITIGHDKIPLAIGEGKRNIIIARDWSRGNLTSPGQERLSQELRGYADKYQCPHVFCFDGEHLLLLQFRARDLSKIRSERCEVDCWLLPRDNPTYPLRYAFYRFLVQGLRRVQGLYPAGDAIRGLVPESVEAYSGRPLFRRDGNLMYSPDAGLERVVSPANGAFYWRDALSHEFAGWDTRDLWVLPGEGGQGN